MSAEPTYLGDGAYARFDGFAVELFTSNGLRTTNTIVCEPEVLRELVAFALAHRVLAPATLRLLAERADAKEAERGGTQG